ncbi:MAG: 1-deoxy-D-xylulose-5-phosphate reductoisomerase [Abditibacteriota bacterium]|nr:1-deoxy-D-xylulose-5-phosphate reductoisomerase [Abditibacteriota bacterium]
MIKISVLGSTGSIGTQVLDVCKRIKDHISVIALGAQNNADLLIKQINEFKPKYACIGNGALYDYVKENIPEDTKLVSDEEGFLTLTEIEADKIIISIAGFPGFFPTLRAIELRKTVCLASKEVLVAGGHIVTEYAKKYNVPILPIDSEHSAIFQCLQGNDKREIKKLILTASGGAFRDKSIEELSKVTYKEALNHPTWKMGKKVTIDSATLMNKGLEIIEAKWLFGVEADQIDVLLHRESIIHSMVEFKDRAVIAQLGRADMRVPIQYSLLYPHRIENGLESLDLRAFGSLNFGYIDYKKFPCLKIAFEVLKEGGNIPCIMNAADDACVKLFMEEKIGFLDIPRIIEENISSYTKTKAPSINELINLDKEVKAKIYEKYNY